MTRRYVAVRYVSDYTGEPRIAVGIRRRSGAIVYPFSLDFAEPTKGPIRWPLVFGRLAVDANCTVTVRRRQAAS